VFETIQMSTSFVHYHAGGFSIYIME